MPGYQRTLLGTLDRLGDWRWCSPGQSTDCTRHPSRNRTWIQSVPPRSSGWVRSLLWGSIL